MIRILLVDDDDLSRGAVHRMLERAGYSVHSTAQGSLAIVRYKTDPSDLVITDLIMPETDGLEIIQELRRIDPAVKILDDLEPVGFGHDEIGDDEIGRIGL